MTKLITWLTSLLVLSVAIGSFILSYNALYQVAIDNGINQQLAWIWPLLIDFSLVVYCLCAIVAYLHSESTWRQWLLTISYTIATIGFNYLHAYPQALSPLASKVIVMCIPPISLFLSFEILMSQLHNGIIRKDKQQSLSVLDGLITQHQAELEQAQSQFVLLLDKLQAVQQQIDTLNAPTDTITERRQKLLSLITNYKSEFGKMPTQRYLAEETGVSIQTIRGDIQALNGQVK